MKEEIMPHHVHHVHLFASDIEKSLTFYKTFFGGVVILDMEVAGARNIFMKIGNGRIHFYAQPPKMAGPGSVHHFGIQTDDVERDYQHMKSQGVPFNKAVVELGYMKYIMAPAPDDVLIELFEVNKALIPAEYHDYFA
jgi:catechol 2,3-dioxygenase-like lactoylglutathione lyase family enzyme